MIRLHASIKGTSRTAARDVVRAANRAISARNAVHRFNFCGANAGAQRKNLRKSLGGVN